MLGDGFPLAWASAANSSKAKTTASSPWAYKSLRLLLGDFGKIQPLKDGCWRCAPHRMPPSTNSIGTRNEISRPFRFRRVKGYNSRNKSPMLSLGPFIVCRPTSVYMVSR